MRAHDLPHFQSDIPELKMIFAFFKRSRYVQRGISLSTRRFYEVI